MLPLLLSTKHNQTNNKSQAPVSLSHVCCLCGLAVYEFHSSAADCCTRRRLILKCPGGAGKTRLRSLMMVGSHLIIPVHSMPMTVAYNTSGHWLYPIYCYAVLSLVNNGLVLPFPPFSNWKRKGTDKPELNLFWQLLQSSNCEGGPAHWCGMICSHPESRQKEPLLFSKCVQPCIDILAEMPAHSHLNGKKTRILGGWGRWKGEWKLIKWQQKTKHELGEEEGKLFRPQDSISLIQCGYICFSTSQLNYAFVTDKGYYNDTEMWKWRKLG